MLGLALGAAKMIGGAAKAKAGKGARVAKNMMGRGGKDNGGGSALVARPSSSIVPRPAESTAIVKAPKAKNKKPTAGKKPAKGDDDFDDDFKDLDLFDDDMGVDFDDDDF